MRLGQRYACNVQNFQVSNLAILDRAHSFIIAILFMCCCCLCVFSVRLHVCLPVRLSPFSVHFSFIGSVLNSPLIFTLYNTCGMYLFVSKDQRRVSHGFVAWYLARTQPMWRYAVRHSYSNSQRSRFQRVVVPAISFIEPPKLHYRRWWKY